MSLPSEPTAGQFWLGTFGQDLKEEVVLAVKSMAPLAYIELHCHGGREVLRYLQEILEERGIQSCSWQELSRRGMHDLLGAEARIELSQAPTVRTASRLLDQVQGALYRALTEIQSALNIGEVTRAVGSLDAILRHAELGQHLTRPWRLALGGAPNVGKSSLANCLAGYARCIVAPTPGTTRDVVTTLLAIDGWPVEMADTAGIREAAGDLEGMGIERSRMAFAQADLCLWLLDASTSPVRPDFSSPKLHLVVNKIDLPAVWDLKQTGEAIRVSARTSEGLADLCTAVSRWLVPAPPAPGEAVPFTPDLAERLEQTRRLVNSGEVEKALLLLETITHATVQSATG
jgi:tRNA modification GTPase